MSRRRHAAATKKARIVRRPRSQSRVPGVHRLPANTSLIAKLESAIGDEMAAYNVSRSWVIASCCAYALGIELPDYREEKA